MAVRLLAAPAALSPLPSSAEQKSEAGPVISSSGVQCAVCIKCRTLPECLNKAFEVYQESKFGFLILLKESILFCVESAESFYFFPWNSRKPKIQFTIFSFSSQVKCLSVWVWTFHYFLERAKAQLCAWTESIQKMLPLSRSLGVLLEGLRCPEIASGHKERQLWSLWLT